MPECEECGRVQPIQDDPNGELCDGCYEDRYLSGPTPEQQEASWGRVPTPAPVDPWGRPIR